MIFFKELFCNICTGLGYIFVQLVVLKKPTLIQFQWSHVHAHLMKKLKTSTKSSVFWQKYALAISRQWYSMLIHSSTKKKQVEMTTFKNIQRQIRGVHNWFLFLPYSYPFFVRYQRINPPINFVIVCPTNKIRIQREATLWDSIKILAFSLYLTCACQPLFKQF